jgi:hypothetical protein
VAAERSTPDASGARRFVELACGATRINEIGMAFEDAVTEGVRRGNRQMRGFSLLLWRPSLPKTGSIEEQVFDKLGWHDCLASPGDCSSRDAGSSLWRRHKAGPRPRRYRDAGGRRHPRHGLALLRTSSAAAASPTMRRSPAMASDPAAGPFLPRLPAHGKKRPLQGLGRGRVNDVSKWVKPASLNLSVPVVK